MFDRGRVGQTFSDLAPVFKVRSAGCPTRSATSWRLDFELRCQHQHFLGRLRSTGLRARRQRRLFDHLQYGENRLLPAWANPSPPVPVPRRWCWARRAWTIRSAGITSTWSATALREAICRPTPAAWLASASATTPAASRNRGPSVRPMPSAADGPSLQAGRDQLRRNLPSHLPSRNDAAVQWPVLRAVASLVLRPMLSGGTEPPILARAAAAARRRSPARSFLAGGAEDTPCRSRPPHPHRSPISWRDGVAVRVGDKRCRAGNKHSAQEASACLRARRRGRDRFFRRVLASADRAGRRPRRTDLHRPRRSVLRLFDLQDLRGPSRRAAGPDPENFTAKAGQIGQVFGIALDSENPPNIFVAASSAYGRPIVVAGADGKDKHVRKGQKGARFMPGLWGAAPEGGPGSSGKSTAVTARFRFSPM